jgi:hypothetical protein
MISIVFCLDGSHGCGRKECVECCTRNGRNGMAGLGAGVWELRGIRREVDKGSCHLCVGDAGV